MRHIVILGNGITGVTAARHLRQRGADRITIVSGETDHHFSRTALMYIFMGDLTYADTKPYEDDFWAKNALALRRGWVSRIDPAGKQLVFADGPALAYDALIIATGSVPNRFGWPGQELAGVQSLYSYQDVELLEKNVVGAKRAVIVGGGLIGVEVAEMLHTRGVAVTFLVREKNFWGSVLPEEEAQLVGREVRANGVDLRTEAELATILPDAHGRVRAITTKGGEEIACELVFLTIGVSPNIALVKAAGIECDRGVLVDKLLRTSVPDVYAAGDCAQHREPPPGRRPVEQVWYTGKIQGEHLAATLSGDERPYAPGIWFNSAKFFDIEYQTYGDVPARLPEGIESFYWEHADGQRSVRVNFRADTLAVTGVNVFGIRHRHNVWEAWIEHGTPVTEALANLRAANFDPEFFVQGESEIIAAFNQRWPAHRIELAAPKGLFGGYLRRLLGRAAI